MQISQISKKNWIHSENLKYRHRHFEILRHLVFLNFDKKFVRNQKKIKIQKLVDSKNC
jgi:hypothetical protein